MSVRSGLAALSAVLILGACASAAPSEEIDLFSGGRASAADVKKSAAKASSEPLGSARNPVRVHMPAGQQAYLRRLRCSDGSRPAFVRQGNVGPGIYGSIVDVYSVTCATGTPKESAIYMDMYHPDHFETGAPPGFTIAP